MQIKILVFDDERQLTRMIGRLLKTQGQEEVAVAHTPQEALACCDQQVFDLVFLDINLKADKSGMDVLHYIKANNMVSAVCMMSAYRDEYEHASLMSGAFKFISKPATLADIQDAIAQVVKQKQALGGADHA